MGSEVSVHGPASDVSVPTLKEIIKIEGKTTYPRKHRENKSEGVCQGHAS